VTVAPVDVKAVVRQADAPEKSPIPASAPTPALAAGDTVDRTPVSVDIPVLAAAESADGHRSSGKGHDSNREGHAREDGDRSSTGVSLTAAQPSAERADTRDVPPSAAQPARQALTLMHGAAPVLVQLQHLDAPVAVANEPAASSTPAADTTERIVQSLKLQAIRGGGDAVLQLRPEHLGPISISLRVENGAVSAVITADHPGVAEWLQSNQQSLRDGLQASGLQLERFVVQRDGQSPTDRQRREWLESRRRDLRRRAPPSDSTFEISM
jgi:flagellar hook-length control protein FliK